MASWCNWVPGPLPGLSRDHEPFSLLPPLGMCWSVSRNWYWRAFPRRPSVGLAVSHQRGEQDNFASCSSVEPKSSLSLSACMHTQLFSHIQLFATPWTVTHQALLSVDFPGKTAGVGCHFLLQGSFWFRDPTIISCIGRQILYHWATRNPLFLHPDQTVYKSAKCSPKLPSCYSLVVSLRRITAEVDSPPPGSRALQREVSAAKSGALLQVPAASETWGI